MPIHLPPISRRQFLRGSLAAGAGLLLPRRVHAAPAPLDPHTWALLADTHIAADRAAISRGVNMTDNLRAVGRELAALPKRPAGVLVNGDCAYLKGEAGDYANLVELLAPMRAAGLPFHLTLGNHDHRENFWAGAAESRAARRPMADRHVAMLRTPRANWFLLDSLDKVNKTPGLLGEAQLRWLATGLDANVGKPAIVCAHHTPDDPQNPTVGLIDTQAFYDLIAPRRQVKAFVFGHSHRWEIKEHAGIHLVNLPPVAYVFKEGMPSGWVQATLQPDGARLQLQSLDPKHAAHGQVVELKWRAG